MNTDIFKKSNKNDVYAKLQQKVGNLLALFNRVLTIENTLAPGLIFDYAGSTAPSGYLICNGQNVSRTTYSKLFTNIGTTYGSGDGSTTFTLPNLKGVVTIGVGISEYADTNFELGEYGGEETHTITYNELPPIQVLGDGPDVGYDGYLTNSGSDTLVETFSTSLGILKTTEDDDLTRNTPHNNMQPYLVVNKIIYTGVFN